MEIALIAQNCLKIKSKKSALVVDANPSLKTKTPADCLVLLNKEGEYSTAKLEGVRLLIKGTGEYEIEGVKISAFSSNSNVSYLIRADNLETILAKSSELKKIQEIVKECQVVILRADTIIEGALIINLSPSVVILYGEKANEVAGLLDGKNANKTDKVQIAYDKLPEEMQITLLAS